MKRKSLLIILSIGMFSSSLLLGCSREAITEQPQTETEISEEKIEAEEETEDEPAEKSEEELEEETEEKPGEESEEKSEEKPQEESDESAESSDEAEKYGMIHFDVLDVDLPYPTWVEEWGKIEVSQRFGNAYISTEKGEFFSLSAFLPEDPINLMTGEPIEYNQYFFDDTDPKNVINWSDEDDFFRIHASVEGIDTFMAIYHGGDCSMTCKLMGPTDEAQMYEEAFDYICESIKTAKPNPQVISEEAIIKYVQGIYKSPCAAVDHYEDGYKPVIHLYEVVENPDESHIATWGWAMVDPVTGEAIDQITYESFVVPGARVNLK